MSNNTLADKLLLRHIKIHHILKSHSSVAQRNYQWSNPLILKKYLQHLYYDATHPLLHINNMHSYPKTNIQTKHAKYKPENIRPLKTYDPNEFKRYIRTQTNSPSHNKSANRMHRIQIQPIWGMDIKKMPVWRISGRNSYPITTRCRSSTESAFANKLRKPIAARQNSELPDRSPLCGWTHEK